MATTKWALDPTHSELQFKVKHLMITTVTGSIKSFSAELNAEGDDFTNAAISFSGDISSIDTGNTDRDNHLKVVISLKQKNTQPSTLLQTALKKMATITL